MAQSYRHNYSRRQISGRLYHNTKIASRSRYKQRFDNVSLSKAFCLYHISGVLILLMLNSVLTSHSQIEKFYSAWQGSVLLFIYGLVTAAIVWSSTINAKSEFWSLAARGASFLVVFVIAYNQIMNWYQIYNLKFAL